MPRRPERNWLVTGPTEQEQAQAKRVANATAGLKTNKRDGTYTMHHSFTSRAGKKVEFTYSYAVEDGRISYVNDDFEFTPYYD